MQVDPCVAGACSSQRFDRSSQCREERKAVSSQLVSTFRVLCRRNITAPSCLSLCIFSPWPWRMRRSQRDIKPSMTGDTSMCVLDGGLQFRPGGSTPTTAGLDATLACRWQPSMLTWQTRRYQESDQKELRLRMPIVYTACVQSTKNDPSNCWPDNQSPGTDDSAKDPTSTPKIATRSTAVGPALAPSNHCRASPGLPETDWSRAEIGQQRGSLVVLLDPDSQC